MADDWSVPTVLPGILQNAAMLLALVVLYQLVVTRFSLQGRPLRESVAGVLVGLMGIAVMDAPVRFEAGIIFDTRSVLLAASGLFLGGIPTVIAMAMTAAFRLFQGGVGGVPGALVVVASGTLGLLWRSRRTAPLHEIRSGELLLLGLTVHIPMLLILRMGLPEEVAPDAVRQVAGPVLLIYPLLTLAVGVLLAQGLRFARTSGSLEESLSRYRSLFDDSHAVMLLLDPEDGRIVDGNHAAAGFYGWARDTLRGMRFSEIQGVSGEAPRVQLALNGSSGDRIFRSLHRRADGSQVSVEILSGPIRVEGRTLVHSIIRDVSREVEAQNQLQASQALYEQVLDLVEEGIWDWDVPGRKVFTSVTAQRILGADRSQVIDPGGWIGTIDPAQRRHVRRELLAAVVRGDPVSLEVRTRHPERGWRWVSVKGVPLESDAQGRVTRMVGRLMDITRQIEADVLVRLQGAALEAASHPIVITDREGLIEWVNPAFEETTGWGSSDAIGRSHGSLFKSGVHDEGFYARMWETILSGQRWHGQITNRYRDGTLHLEEQTITPVRDERGEITHFVAIKQDVSERLEMESRLRQAQRMESVGRLAGGIAHDFNNLLTVINATADLRLADLPEEADGRRELQEIRDAGARAASLTRQLLAFSRRQIMQAEPVKPAGLMKDLLTMLERLIGEDVSIRFEADPDPWLVTADPSQLEQVALNLALNARDAMPSGGTLTLEVRNRTLPPDDPDLPQDAPSQDFVEFVVEDTGVGMTPEVLERAFEPFFTTKPAGKGTGLGLSTVYGIVTQSGGGISVQTKPSVGTRFRILLPRAHEGSADVPRSSVASDGSDESPPTEQRTILLVEDEGSIRHVTSRILTRHGFRVIATDGGPAALAILEAGKDPVDLVLTDVVMPGMSGPELVAEVRARWPGIRVLFTSGYTDDTLLRLGVEAETIHFIGKPYTVEDLIAKVQGTLRQDPGH